MDEAMASASPATGVLEYSVRLSVRDNADGEPQWQEYTSGIHLAWDEECFRLGVCEYQVEYRAQREGWKNSPVGSFDCALYRPDQVEIKPMRSAAGAAQRITVSHGVVGASFRWLQHSLTCSDAHLPLTVSTASGVYTMHTDQSEVVGLLDSQLQAGLYRLCWLRAVDGSTWAQGQDFLELRIVQLPSFSPLTAIVGVPTRISFANSQTEPIRMPCPQQLVVDSMSGSGSGSGAGASSQCRDIGGCATARGFRKVGQMFSLARGLVNGSCASMTASQCTGYDIDGCVAATDCCVCGGGEMEPLAGAEECCVDADGAVKPCSELSDAGN